MGQMPDVSRQPETVVTDPMVLPSEMRICQRTPLDLTRKLAANLSTTAPTRFLLNCWLRQYQLQYQLQIRLALGSARFVMTARLVQQQAAVLVLVTVAFVVGDTATERAPILNECSSAVYWENRN